MDTQDIIEESMETQQAHILEHLQNIGPLTPKEALKRYGCFRLASQIFNLKKKGYEIRCDLEYLYDEQGRKTKRYGVYSLVGEAHA